MSGLSYGTSEVAPPAAKTMPTGRRVPLKALLIAFGLLYVLGLHLVLGVVALKSDFRERLEKRLGELMPRAEFDANYKRWAAAFARQDSRARPGGLVFLGDSIMRDLDTSSIARHTLNLAIPGDTTARILRRMQNYQSVRTARGVVLGVGINDLGYRSVPDAVENYRRMLALVPAAVPVMMLAVLPVDERIRHNTHNADIARLDEGLSALCAGRPGCHFVDASPALRDDTGNLAAKNHDGDGLHLSHVGHDAYWEAVNAAVLTYMPPAVVTPPAA